MAVFLGNAGAIRFARLSAEDFRSTMDRGDVDVAQRRFSFDFPNGTFQTGDRLRLKRLNPDGSISTQPLDFIDPSAWADNSQHPDGAWYVHVDPLGGIKLYDKWADALNGGQGRAKPLQLPASDYPISAGIEEGSQHYLGGVTSFTVSQERFVLDVTALGDAFQGNTSGLIGMRGELTCFWDWREPNCGDRNLERAQYLHELILRQQLGAEFDVELIIKQYDAQPINEERGQDDPTVVALKGVCLLTSAGLEFDPVAPLVSQFEFVSKGDLAIVAKPRSGFDLLMEDGGYLDMEDDERIQV